MTSVAEPKCRTITMTGRAPVRLVEEEWPIVARGRDWQGLPARRWYLHVRRHHDGRTLVYGRHETSITGEHDVAGGELLPSAASAEAAAAIHSVGTTIGAPDALIAEVIAGLPPEEI
jgi:hypothetical protein